MACDLAVMVDDAFIRHVGPEHGSVPAGGATQWLTIMVGDRRAREIVLMCEEIPAREGRGVGARQPRRAGRRARRGGRRMVENLARKLPQTTRYAKQHLNFWKDLAWHETINHARDWLALSMATEEPKAGDQALPRGEEVRTSSSVERDGADRGRPAQPARRAERALRRADGGARRDARASSTGTRRCAASSSAGTSARSPPAPTSPSWRQASAIDLYYQRRIERWDAIRGLWTPLVAAVSGYCLGGGCELAMACDLIVASESAQFGQPETGVGVIPGAGGTQRLTRAVGKALAMDVILSGRLLSAQEALAAGLVARVVAEEAWLDEAKRVAREIAAKAPDRDAPREGGGRPRLRGPRSQPASRTSGALLYLAFASEDAKEGLTAFTREAQARVQGPLARL